MPNLIVIYFITILQLEHVFCMNTILKTRNLHHFTLFYPKEITVPLYVQFERYPPNKKSDTTDIFDYFNDDCDMDEMLGDVAGYSRLCRIILDYRDSHVVKINPYIDYRFSISLRDDNNEWTPYLRMEYQYSLCLPLFKPRIN